MHVSSVRSVGNWCIFASLGGIQSMMRPHTQLNSVMHHRANVKRINLSLLLWTGL